jgi:hypothetical protein
VDTTLGASGRRDGTTGTAGAASGSSEVARRLEALWPARAADSGLADTLMALRAKFEAKLPPDQLRHLDAAAQAASAIVFDAVADDGRVVPGQEVHVTLTVWNPSSRAVQVSFRLEPREGWKVMSPAAPARLLEPGQVMRSDVTVTAGERLTSPYFALDPIGSALYRWDHAPPDVRGLPFAPPPLSASFMVTGARGHYATEREVVFPFVDQARGEIRRPLMVVPRVDVKLDPSTDLWSTLSPEAHRLTVTLIHGSKDTTVGQIGLTVPQGWPSVPVRSFRLEREDERETFTFEVRAPAGYRNSSAEIRAVVRDGTGRVYDSGDYNVAYPHIRPRSYLRPALTIVRLAILALPRLSRVGYVVGAADRVPEALRDVGVPLVLLDREALEHADLRPFDAIVIGPRAYETDSALVDNNSRLLRYVRDGGLLIVQYQQQFFFHGNFAPFPLTVGGPLLVPPGQSSTRSPGASQSQTMVAHDRVADETAPVRVLTPDDPVAVRPNRLERSDWQGWVQERGLYFARSWDSAYRPILETHDPGEAPLEGGLLTAKVGKGTYVYTGLSFFRQLPAGVPGAFRLFANLLALARGR